MLIYNLPGRLSGEKIIKVIRKDFFILIKKAILTAVLIVLPSLVVYMILHLYPNLLDGQISYPLIVLTASGYGLFICLFAFFLSLIIIWIFGS